MHWRSLHVTLTEGGANPPSILIIMRKVTFESDLFSGYNQERSIKSSLILLEALTGLNFLFLKQHGRETPILYKSGVVYAPEYGKEDWKTIPLLVVDGFGDCEDLAAWRVAELRYKGDKKARCALKKRQVGDHTRLHAIVRRGDGRYEDPSAKLGMNAYAAMNDAYFRM